MCRRQGLQRARCLFACALTRVDRAELGDHASERSIAWGSDLLDRRQRSEQMQLHLDRREPHAPRPDPTPRRSAIHRAAHVAARRGRQHPPIHVSRRKIAGRRMHQRSSVMRRAPILAASATSQATVKPSKTVTLATERCFARRKGRRPIARRTCACWVQPRGGVTEGFRCAPVPPTRVSCAFVGRHQGYA